MSEIARLRTEIAARKHRANELAIEIGRRIREICELVPALPQYVKIKDVQLSLIARLAKEAADMQDQYLKLMEEIEQGEKELG